MADAIIDGTNINTECFSYSAPKAHESGGKVVNVYNKYFKESLTISSPLILTWGAQEGLDQAKKPTGKFTMSLQFPNADFPNEKGNILSKKYLLQAGLTDHTGGDNSYQLRSGISSNGAYGIGGTDFGYKPMPGLENLSIKTGGKLGTLREATFEFTCYNMKQLEIIGNYYYPQLLLVNH
jgi:hypothetical protein